MNKSLKLLLAALVGLFLVTLGFAQDAAPVDPAPNIAEAKLPGGIPVAAVLSLAATVVVAGIKFAVDKLGTKIKPALIPLIALVVSFALDWLSRLTFGTESNGWLALGAGLAAVGLNQFKKQILPAPDPKSVG